MKVPLLDLKAQYAGLREEMKAALDEVLESQYFVLGPKVEEFEGRIAEYVSTRHAVGVASGSDAILLSLMALGIGPEDEVITTPYTFFSTAGCVARLRAGILFADIELSTYNIDINEVRRLIETRAEFDGQVLKNRDTGRKIRALLPVHLFGQSCDMNPFLELSERYNLAVIEDAAQSIGSEYQGRRVGGLGDFGAFSFFPSKNLGGLGDGGIVTMQGDEYAEAVKTLRVHGARMRYYHDVVGMNSRLDALQAAGLLVKLQYLDTWIDERRRNADRYRALFREHGLLEDDLVILPEVQPYANRHVYNQFVIRVPGEKRDGLLAHLRENGIGVEIYYPVPLHRQRCFESLGYDEGSFPVAEKAAAESLALPVYPELSGEGQETVVKAIKEYLRE
jgi:dTDP-4-amino-4,6-dideoxygalactose transaminase